MAPMMLPHLPAFVAGCSLPPFQRGYVWTPEQAELLLDSVCRGYPIGAILMWSERRRGIFPPETAMVLDGQQRLTALTGLRPGGEVIHVPCWDLDEGRPRVFAPDTIPASAWPMYSRTYDLYALAEARGSTREQRHAVMDAVRTFNDAATIPVHFVHGTRADAVEAFRRVNACGTAIGAEELAGLIAKEQA